MPAGLNQTVPHAVSVGTPLTSLHAHLRRALRGCGQGSPRGRAGSHRIQGPEAAHRWLHRGDRKGRPPHPRRAKRSGRSAPRKVGGQTHPTESTISGNGCVLGGTEFSHRILKQVQKQRCKVEHGCWWESGAIPARRSSGSSVFARVRAQGLPPHPNNGERGPLHGSWVRHSPAALPRCHRPRTVSHLPVLVSAGHICHQMCTEQAQTLQPPKAQGVVCAEPPSCTPGTAAAFLLGATSGASPSSAGCSALPRGDSRYFQRNSKASREGSIPQANEKKSREPFTDHGWSGLGPSCFRWQ